MTAGCKITGVSGTLSGAPADWGWHRQKGGFAKQQEACYRSVCSVDAAFSNEACLTFSCRVTADASSVFEVPSPE